jgi:hypothetical protein
MVKLVPAGMLAVALVTATVQVSAAPQTPSDAVIYATGLEAPRGLRFCPDGLLCIAEAALRVLRISGVFATDNSESFICILRRLKGVRDAVTADAN